MATVRIIARFVLVAVCLLVLQEVVETYGTSVPFLPERLMAVSAGYFLVFAGTLISSSHGRPIFGIAIMLVPMLWLNAFSLDTASRWLVPGISGLLIGAALHYLLNERTLRPTLTNANRPTDGLPIPRPERITPLPSADNPSRSTRPDDTSGPNRPISPRGTERYDQRTRQT